MAVPFGAKPPLARCWLFAGGLRLGRGPVVGTRRPDAALRGGARPPPTRLWLLSTDRAGGGIRPLAAAVDDAPGFGGGGMVEAHCVRFVDAESVWD